MRQQQNRSKVDGHETRGKTARNRLRRTDTFALMFDRPLLQRRDGLFAKAMFVDVGYGAYPYTVLESGERLRQANGTLAVLGVEIDPERVAAARPYRDEQTDFRLGGFNLPLHRGETVRLIRAFNVLRQYEEAAVAAAHQQIASYLLPDGLLIEGTSNKFGQTWVANVVRRTAEGGEYEAVVFSTNFHLGFDPADFQPVLPKNFIHRMVVGEPIFHFMEDWKQAYRQALPYSQWGPRQHFRATADCLAEMGYKIDRRRKWLDKGFLIWYRQEILWRD